MKCMYVCILRTKLWKIIYKINNEHHDKKEKAMTELRKLITVYFNDKKRNLINKKIAKWLKEKMMPFYEY